MDVISYSLSKKYTDEKTVEQKLKISKVEKEINDFRNTFNQMNINQEATQKASGYGIISLPKNAANGQVSVSVKGETLTNLVDNGIDNSNWLGGGLVSKNGITISATSGDSYVRGVKLKPNTKYTIILDVISKEGNADIRMSNNFTGAYWVIASNIGKTKKTFTTKSDLTSTTLILFCSNVAEGNIKFNNVMILEGDYTDRDINYIEGTKSTIGAMRITSENEDKTEKSQAYIIAKDKDNKIVNLRSLPNGVKDEVRVNEGKAIIKNKEYVLQARDIGIRTTYTNLDYAAIKIPTDYIYYGVMAISGRSLVLEGYIADSDTAWDNINHIGKYYQNAQEGYVWVGFPKGTTLEQVKQQLIGAKLTYQLEEPIITPIQVSGNLITYPSGTIYIEPVVADAGIYGANGIGVLHQELPINYIEKISKIDFETGLETELDTSQAIISEDGTYFTHPELVEGDIVFFEYYYPSDMTTQGETEVEYYDSRYVIQDSVTGKFYKWTIAVADGVPSIQLQEV